MSVTSTNRSDRSWSIDDRRDKFQFGCELGRLIRDGELAGLVRGPGYRGRSATFWRSPGRSSSHAIAEKSTRLTRTKA